MGFSLKKAIGGGVIGAAAGQFLGGGVGSVIGGAIGLKKGGKLFGSNITPADPEASELRKIKLNAARGEAEALKKFRERMDADTSGIVQGRIEREDVGLAAAQRDAERGTQAQIAQRGLGRSSIGLNALANIQRQSAEQRAQNRATFSERLDRENKGRLVDFRNVASGTLANQNVPIRFRETKEDSFGKSLLKGAVTSAVGGGASAFGKRMGS